MPDSVVSSSGIILDKENMDKASYGFQTVSLRNRLDMDIQVDIRPLLIKNEVVVVVRANKGYHRTTVSKNIEHIAHQLRHQYANEGLGFSIVEYADRHHKKDDYEEWWQWRFNWVGKTPLDGQRYLLSASKINVIQMSMANIVSDLQCVS